MQSIIRVEHVYKHITDSSGTLEILHDINFEVPECDSVAIMGASGSGKSTMLGIIAGLDYPSQGVVRLVGQDIFVLSEDARAAFRAKYVGFVFQSFQLMSNLTALENVMLPLELANDRKARQKAQIMLERVGLAERLAHYPKVLSGGEQQRVALARAFVVEPKILLADEPTGSLDFATGLKVMDLMMMLNQEHGTTLLLVTHDKEVASRCNRQLRVESGRIVEVTSVAI